MPALSAVPADINDLRFCASIIFIVKITFGIQHFAVQKTDFLSLSSFEAELHIAGHLLAEINDGFPGRSDENPFRLNSLLFQDLFPLLRNENIIGPFQNFGPQGISRSKGGVIMFPVINFTESHRTFGAFPGFIAGENAFRPILIIQMNFYK